MTAPDIALPLTESAPAKVNLCLLLGPTRASDGRHELVTVFQPLALADTVRLHDAPDATEDSVYCPDVAGPNLAAAAIAAFRDATGWDGPPVRIEIDKRIPVAGGMAGGSADAAATLRLLRRHAGWGDDATLHTIGARLGADVPAQVNPRRWLATGAGERLRPLDGPSGRYGVLVVPAADGLSTASVFARADELGLPRADLAAPLAKIEAALAPDGALPTAHVVNDLEPAALDLRPELGATLEAVRTAGADVALVSGSGPTVIGLFADRAACEQAATRIDGAIVTVSR